MNNEDFESRWQQLEQMLQQRFGNVPNMDALLYLIGINEYQGIIPENKFTKEEKEDLIHIAVCTLLSKGGYYRKVKTDEEGWPHFDELKTIAQKDLDAQEELLKIYILEYFDY
ncbi:MAG TPA: hypothetical protein VLZ83_12330 [Edaphocola sp.]|nr:hypothetical protein [Edaphocola sp.]